MKSIKTLLTVIIILFFKLSFAQIDSLNNELFNMFGNETEYFHSYYSNYNPVVDLIEQGADINAKSKYGSTLLSTAVRSNRIELIKLLLYLNARTDIPDSKGLTAYQIAENKADKEIFEFMKDPKFDQYFLAEYGTLEELKAVTEKNPADINKPDKYGYTILDLAVARTKNAVEFVNFLIDKGVDLNFNYVNVLDIAIINENFEMARKFSLTDSIKDHIRPLNLAIRRGNFEMAKLLIDAGININSSDYFDRKPIIYAAQDRFKNKEIIRYMIEKALDVKSKDNQTVLHHLFKFDRYDEYNNYTDKLAIKMLIEKGADVNAKDNLMNTPLHYAALNPVAIDAMKLLLETGAQTESKNKNGSTPFHLATETGNIEAVKLLTGYITNYDESDNEGNSLLHYAASFENAHELVKFFLEKGLDVNAENKYKQTPLHFASKVSDNSKTIELLIEAGSDVDAVDNRKNRPLTYAVEEGRFENTKTLIESGAEYKTKVKGKNSELKISLNRNHNDITEYLIGKDAFKEDVNLISVIKLGNLKILNLLIDKGVDVNKTNYYNEVPIITAVKHNRIDMLTLLIESGADINALQDNYSVLHYAAFYNRSEMIKILINQGVDIKHRNSGKTPLHYAAETENGVETVKILTENGANVNALDNDNMTPLQCAIKYNNTKTVEFLKPLTKKNKKIKKGNDLLFDKLIIYNRVPLDSLHYKFNEESLEADFYSRFYYGFENFNNFNFSNLIIDKLSKGKIKGYKRYNPYLTEFEKQNMFFKELSKEEINNNLGNEKGEFIMEDEIGELITVEYVSEADPLEINGIMFYEDWNFNEDAFSFQKKILSYSPIRRHFSDDDLEMFHPRYKLVSFLNFESLQNKRSEKDLKKRAELFKKLKYEFYIHDERAQLYYKDIDPDLSSDLHLFEKEGSPLWSTFSKNKIKRSIIDKVVSNEIDAFDFYSGEKLSVNEVYRRFNALKDTVWTVDWETGEEMMEVTEGFINTDEIKSFIFIEDWYLDNKTMQIVKDIIGIAPVRWYSHFDDIDSEERYSIPFAVYFKEPKHNQFDLKKISDNVPIDDNYMTLNGGILNKHMYYWDKDLNDFNFKKSFIDKIRKKDIELYMNYEYDDIQDFDSDSYELINAEELTERIGINTDTIYTYGLDGEQLIKVEKTEGYGTDSVSVIRFHENWQFDTDNFKFYKDVFAYSPGIRFYRDDEPDISDPRHKLIGYLISESDLSTKDMVLFKKIKYEFGNMDIRKHLSGDIFNIENEKPLFWNSYNQRTFKETIFKTAKSGKINCYDFNTAKLLSSEDFEKNLLLASDTIYDIDIETGDLTEYIEDNKIDETKINSFIFIENWYIDKSNLNIKKEVVGIAPVVYYITDPETMKYKKIIPFVLYFDESKRF